MPEEPNFPTQQMLAALAFLADVAGLTCLFLANLPLVLKVGVGALGVLIPIAAFFYYLGEKHGWRQRDKHGLQLEQEVTHLHGSTASPKNPKQA